VDGVLRACEAPRANGQIINVATGGRISLNTLFQEMRAVIGGKVEPTYAEARQGDVRDSQADIQKAKDVLDYKPIVSFEEGLKRTIDWYRGAHAIVTA
jgi:nucleoside-diphosphate-sugar epimerase